jgi:hypothetical protein
MKNMSILATLDRKINHSDRDFSALLEVNNAPLHNANPYLGVKSPSEVQSDSPLLTASLPPDISRSLADLFSPITHPNLYLGDKSPSSPLHNANPYLGVKSPSTSVTEGQSPPILWEEQPQFKVQSFNRRDKGWRSVSGWLYEANKERSLLF